MYGLFFNQAIYVSMTEGGANYGEWYARRNSQYNANTDATYGPLSYSITTDGHVIVGGKLFIISDARVKNSILPLCEQYSYQAIMNIIPASYIKNGSKDIESGYIGQQVRRHLPNCVHVGPRKIGDTTVEDFHEVDYQAVACHLHAAFKHLAARVEELEKQIQKLSNDR